MSWQEFLRRLRCLIACCNSQIIVENSQWDGKPPENDKGEATGYWKSYTMISKTRLLMLENPSWAAPRSKETWPKYINRGRRRVAAIPVSIYLTYTSTPQLQNEASRGASNRWTMADWYDVYE